MELHSVFIMLVKNFDQKFQRQLGDFKQKERIFASSTLVENVVDFSTVVEAIIDFSISVEKIFSKLLWCNRKR